MFYQGSHRRVTARPKLLTFTITFGHYQSTISGFHFDFNKTSSVFRKLKLLGRVEKKYFSCFFLKKTDFSMRSQKLKC